MLDVDKSGSISSRGDSRLKLFHEPITKTEEMVTSPDGREGVNVSVVTDGAGMEGGTGKEREDFGEGEERGVRKETQV